MPTSDVDSAIVGALGATALAALPAGDAAQDILKPLHAIALKGKRLRARLLLASHDAHHGQARDVAVHVAAAIELFQTAALIHDDVLDSADTRRGDPTIHRALQTQHANASWTGNSSHFGVSAAVLAGDLALMAAHRSVGVAAAALGPEQGARVINLFADMAELCTAGQYLDMRLAAQPVDAVGAQDDDIVAVMRSKTASYTAEFPLALGAAVAGVSDDAVTAMRNVGVPLGIAFQLRDDILGLAGAPEVTGKPAGDDVREGKRTVLVSHAWKHGDDTMRSALVATLGNADASTIDIALVADAVVESGAVAAAEAHIQALVADCRAALAGAIAMGDLRQESLHELEALIAATTERSA